MLDGQIVGILIICRVHIVGENSRSQNRGRFTRSEHSLGDEVSCKGEIVSGYFSRACVGFIPHAAPISWSTSMPSRLVPVIAETPSLFTPPA